MEAQINRRFRKMFPDLMEFENRVDYAFRDIFPLSLSTTKGDSMCFLCWRKIYYKHKENDSTCEHVT